MNSLINFLTALKLINREIFDASEEGEQSIIALTGIGILGAAFCVSVIFGSFVGVMIGSWLVGLLFGMLVALMFYLHDKSFLAPVSGQRILFRFLISMLLAFVLTVPLKVWILKNQLAQQLKEEVALYNDNVYNEHVTKLELQLQEEMKAVQNEIIQYGKADENGRLSQGQQLVEARRKRDTLEAKSQRLIATEKEKVNKLYKEADTSLLGLLEHFVTQTFSGQLPITEYFINGAILLLFLIIEASPAIGASILYNSQYIQALRDRREGKQFHRNHARQLRELAEEQIKDIDNVIYGENVSLAQIQKNLVRRELLQVYANLANNNFTNDSDLAVLEKLLEKLIQMDQPNNSLPDATNPQPEDNQNPKKPDQQKDEQLDDFLNPEFSFD